MTPEDEEFNRVEMESRIKQEYVRDIKIPTREQLIAEVAVLTELVRVLSDRVKELEGASNTLTWVGLTDEEMQDCLKGLPTQTIDVYARRIEAKLKEKNNG